MSAAVTCRVGDLCEQLRGVSYSRSDATQSNQAGYKAVLRANNITKHGLTFDDLVYVPESCISERQLLKAGDVVIAASSGSLDVVGKAAHVVRDLPAGFGAFCKVLRPNSLVDAGYFAHYFQTPNYRSKISSLAAGANINNIRNEHLDNLEIRLPTLPEQRRIAAILDKASALRTRRRAAIAKLDELLQSVFIHMFGDPITNPKAKVEELSELCSRITDGTHQSPQWAESGVPFLFQSNVKPFEIDFSTKKSISVEEYKSLTARCPIEYGDVLFTIVGSYGNAAMVKTQEKFCFQRHIAHLKPHKDVLPQFLEAMLNQKAIKQQADERVTGVAQKTLILKELRALKVLHPPLIEQQKFSVIVTKIQTIKSEMRRSAEKLDELFLSLQQRAFSGKL
ncbi:restriction endonuclease subunit S [Bordetella bronchiseptica]|uniref:restriction endonuclease subunit S n=1 Tax=Bordetella bronchiseptica TaxID=518 RepID=UPI0009B863C7|nr:restriction endonuclease subunit S [Bordetella bronchiseptica]